MLYLLVRLYLHKYIEFFSGPTPEGGYTVDVHLGAVVLWGQGKALEAILSWEETFSGGVWIQGVGT